METIRCSDLQADPERQLAWRRGAEIGARRRGKLCVSLLFLSGICCCPPLPAYAMAAAEPVAQIVDAPAKHQVAVSAMAPGSMTYREIYARFLAAVEQGDASIARESVNKLFNIALAPTDSGINYRFYEFNSIGEFDTKYIYFESSSTYKLVGDLPSPSYSIQINFNSVVAGSPEKCIPVREPAVTLNPTYWTDVTPTIFCCVYRKYKYKNKIVRFSWDENKQCISSLYLEGPL